MTNIAIYIPAYNVGYTLPRVLERIPKELSPAIKEILIVDNASTDDTYIKENRSREVCQCGDMQETDS